MNASFIKRLGAFILDITILSVIFSLITIGFNMNVTDNINGEINDVLEQYQNNEITIEEYTDKVIELNYELQKSSLLTNLVNIVHFFPFYFTSSIT